MTTFTLDNLRELPADAPVRDVAIALDTDVPGWHRKVDLDKIDMQSGCRCIAGQVARSWRKTDEWQINGYDKLSERLDRWYLAFSSSQPVAPWKDAIRARLRRDKKASA